MSLLWPGHNFLGPGNDAFRPESPVDSDDAIAQRHDIAYATARRKEDIWQADRETFFEFAHDAITNRNWHSAVAAPIIGGKYLLETSLNTTLYPRSMPVGKRLSDEHVAGGKRPKPTEDGGAATAAPLPDSQGVTQSGQDGANPQAGSSLPGGTGASVASTIIRNPSSGMHTVRFNKTFQLYTGGFQFRNINKGDLSGMHAVLARQFSNNAHFLMTPLAILNPDYKGLFMSPLEWQTLSQNITWASECRIRLKPLGYRLPFATNEAASGFANSQTLVQCAYGVGLNNQMNIIEGGYGTTGSDLTLPTTITDFDHGRSLYGLGGTVGANVGIPRHWNNYCTVAYQTTASSDTMPSPNLLDFICVENVNDTKGMPVVEYKYDYKCGLINVPEAVIQMRDALANDSTDPNSADFGLKRYPEGFIHTNFSYANGSGIQEIGSDYDVINWNNYTRFNDRIEKAPIITRNVGNGLTPDCPPMVFFGCMPVQSNAALSPNASFANAVIQWVVETELITHTHHDLFMPDLVRTYVTQSWDPQTWGGTSISFGASNTYNPPVAYIANRAVTYVAPPPSQEARGARYSAETMIHHVQPSQPPPNPNSPSFQNYQALMEEEKRKARKNFIQPNTRTA